jgi:hypothetical protein
VEGEQGALEMELCEAGPLEAEPGVLEAELSEEEMEAELDWLGRCAC